MTRLARFRSVTVNNCPMWECSRCGERRHPSAHPAALAAHEARCGHPATNPEETEVLAETAIEASGAKKTITLLLPYRCPGAHCQHESHRPETRP